jgi:2-polyprenyl-6-methoxyphenol hydroxylase-like FAD-dependent oxidoreductase
VAVAESAITIFKRLAEAKPPEQASILFETACVLGGSVAGLLAARVLADHARQVVVIERDTVTAEDQPRPGVPQDQQLHVLLPGGFYWLERWLTSFTREMLDHGAELAEPGQFVQYLDGQKQLQAGQHRLLMASRPFIESRIRAKVLALPNVTIMQSQATGLECRDGRVTAVHCGSGETLPADIVVDAMGRASKLSDWLSSAGYDRPELQRLPTGISYTSALFKRTAQKDEPELATAARFTPPYPLEDLVCAAVCAIENDQWLATVMGYGDIRPGRDLKTFQETCAKLLPAHAQLTGDPVTGEILSYYQADSRRRDYAGLTHLPAGLVSVGDAVASFNPIYGQGMSSAALHASCLSEYLKTKPDPGRPATAFFDLQKIVVDAAWSISAGGDAARLDTLSGAEVPEEVARQRWAFDQLIHATHTDEVVSRAFDDVCFMVAHPDTLADPALLDRAIAARSGHWTGKS